MFYRRASLEQWLLLDANPNVVTFCERPGYVLINVHYVDRGGLVVLSESFFGIRCRQVTPRAAGTAGVRFVVSAELVAARA